MPYKNQYLTFLCCIFAIAPIPHAVSQREGQPAVKWGYLNMTKYIPGNSNIILSVPHDGTLEPGEYIPERARLGCLLQGQTLCTWNETTCAAGSSSTEIIDVCDAVLVRDHNAIPATLEIATQMVLRGKKPHIVQMLMTRRKIDVNRESLDEACQNNKHCDKIYRDYHRFLSEARASIKGPGLLLDIHAQKHPAHWIELGYGIYKRDLNAGRYYALDSTIYALFTRSKLLLESLMSGNRSLGGLLEKQGYKVVPSPTYPTPGKKDYYRGAFISQYHGRSNDCIDAIQVESPKILMIDPKRYTKYARNLADSALEFMEDHGYFSEENSTCPMINPKLWDLLQFQTV